MYAEAYGHRGKVKCKLGDIESAHGDAEKARWLYHQGATDHDKFIQLNNPEEVNGSATDLMPEKVKNSTVRVMNWAADFYGGSGFFVERDRIATNIHVVARPGPVFAKLRDEEDIWEVKEVTAFDVASDLVILKVDRMGIPLSLGDSEMVKGGESVVAMGYPDSKYNVTESTLHGIRNSGRWIQMKADTYSSVGSGGSGGPVLNVNGEVIGILDVGTSSYRYAITSNILKRLLAQPEATEPLVGWQKRQPIRAHTLLSQGQEKYHSDRYHDAITDYDKAIEIYSRFFCAYYQRGMAKFALGNHEAAIADWDKAIEIDDEYLNIYFHRGEAKCRLGQSETASEDIEQAQPFFEAAIADFDQAIRINPEDPDCYRMRGATKLLLGQSHTAKGTLRKHGVCMKHPLATLRRPSR